MPTPASKTATMARRRELPAESMNGSEASATAKIAAATAQTPWKVTTMNWALSNVNATADPA